MTSTSLSLKEFYNLQFTNALLLQKLKQTLFCGYMREDSNFSNNSQGSEETTEPQKLF